MQPQQATAMGKRGARKILVALSHAHIIMVIAWERMLAETNHPMAHKVRNTYNQEPSSAGALNVDPSQFIIGQFSWQPSASSLGW